MTRNTRTRKLSQRGVAAVAAATLALVLLAAAGHATTAFLGAVALYLLVTGRVAALLPTPRQVLRTIAWGAVAAAAVMASQGSTAPSGPALGVALAAALAVALRLTRRSH